MGKSAYSQELFSRPQAAELLGVCTKTLNQMWREKKIRFAAVGKRFKVPIEEIERIKQSEVPCPSTEEVRSSITNSGSTVFDFAALRAARQKHRREKSRPKNTGRPKKG